MRLLLLLLLLPVYVSGQSIRNVNIECRALFPFDPLTGRYTACSMAQAAEYIEQWRENDSVNLSISTKNLITGYKIYEQLADSTITRRVLDYFAPYAAIDSVSNPVDFSRMPHSRRFTEYFDRDIKEMKRFFATPIATISDTDQVSYSYYGASDFSSIFHKFQLDASGAEVSLFAPPSQVSSLKSEIYITDIYKLFTFNNDLSTVSMTGKQIKDFLENIYTRRFYSLRDENSDLLRTKTPYFMNISAAGVDYRYNLTKGKIENFSLRLDSTYKVVGNSFILSKIGTVENIGDYRILLVMWMMSQKTIKPELIENWRLYPERWVEVISKRESKLIYENQ